MMLHGRKIRDIMSKGGYHEQIGVLSTPGDLMINVRKIIWKTIEFLWKPCLMQIPHCIYDVPHSHQCFTPLYLITLGVFMIYPTLIMVVPQCTPRIPPVRCTEYSMCTVTQTLFDWLSSAKKSYNLMLR